ncbi:hypothetical protein ARMGADRAFT_1026157 [Armillaria gallica]|uniref:Uncharacterized protein n=1 Tax=Armillaria gallica TaxID=47427 RepID=A0A2H3E2V0_ARMGA|nr:hypothetical protein ARMGADRAFT_1026157 [Armillaria gallica]
MLLLLWHPTLFWSAFHASMEDDLLAENLEALLNALLLETAAAHALLESKKVENEQEKTEKLKQTLEYAEDERNELLDALHWHYNANPGHLSPEFIPKRFSKQLTKSTWSSQATASELSSKLRTHFTRKSPLELELDCNTEEEQRNTFP